MADERNTTARAWRPPVTDPLAPQLDAAVGTVAEETARLLRALRERESIHATAPPGGAARPGAEEPAQTSKGHGQAEDPSDAGFHAPGTTCTWCPVCRSVDLVRTLSPQTLERLADLAAVAASTVAELAVQARQTQADGAQPHPARASTHDVPVTDDPEEDL